MTMIKMRAMMNLDGDFAKDFPAPEQFTLKQGDDWTVVERGPKYINSYAVTEFDAAGLAWLERHRKVTPREALREISLAGGSDSPETDPHGPPTASP